MSTTSAVALCWGMLGRDAEFVVFNPDLTLVETYVGGNSVGNAFTE